MKKMTINQFRDEFAILLVDKYKPGFYSEKAYTLFKVLEAVAKSETYIDRSWTLHHADGEFIDFSGNYRHVYIDGGLSFCKQFAACVNGVIVEPNGKICLETKVVIGVTGMECPSIPNQIMNGLLEFRRWLKSVRVADDETLSMRIGKTLPGVLKDVGAGLQTSFHSTCYTFTINDISKMIDFYADGKKDIELIGAPNDPILAEKNTLWKKEVDDVKVKLKDFPLSSLIDTYRSFIKELKASDGETCERVKKIVNADCFIESKDELMSEMFKIVDVSNMMVT